MDRETAGSITEARIRARGSDEPTAARPQSDLNRRVHEELQRADERRQQVRNGGPDDMAELDRELTMIQGAMQAVQNRVAELVGALTPVLGNKTIVVISNPESSPMVAQEGSMTIETEYGRRMRGLQAELSEVENVLIHLAHGVRA